MERFSTPEEAAKAITFVAHTKIGFMTGADIVVDGGMTNFTFE